MRCDPRLGSGAVHEYTAADDRTSRALAVRMERWRDDGVRRVGLVVGGADGLDPAFLARADHRLAFGALTWPHALARAMLAEQLYRMTTLLAGLPYHRD